MSVVEGSGNEISGNEIDGRNTSPPPFFGIIFQDGARMTAKENKVTGGNRAGIAFSVTLDSRLFHNLVLGNLYGISLGGPAAGNHVFENLSLNNTTYDASDENRAANTWERNWCRTDNPPGTICRQ